MFVEDTIPNFLVDGAVGYLTRKDLQRKCRDPDNIYCCDHLKSVNGIEGETPFCKHAVGYKAKNVRTNNGYEPVHPVAKPPGKWRKFWPLRPQNIHRNQKTRVNIRPSSPSDTLKIPALPINPMREIIHDYSNSSG